MFVRFSPASCGGSAPTWQGWTPASSTRQGTSTQQPSGRFVISPVFGTFAFMRKGVPVSIAWMM
jgi:hypothetical protein